MAQDDPLTGGGKHDVMLAHDVATPYGAETNIPPPAGTSDAVTPPIRHLTQIDPPPFGGSLAQHQRRAGRRIDLLIVVIFDYLNVIIRIQGGGDLAGQNVQQIDPEAHVARPHDNRVPCSSPDPCQIVFGQTRGANHMHRPRLRRQFGKGHRRGRSSEIDHRLCPCKTVQRIIRNDHPHRRTAHRGAHILTHPDMTGAFNCPCKVHPGMFVDFRHQHLSHAPGHSGDDNPDIFTHENLRRWISASIAADPRLGKARKTAYVPDMAKNRSHSSEGPSQRQLRVGELIRRTLSEVLARGDIHDPDLNRYSITVGEVRTSPDLRVATAYVVPLGGKGQEDVLDLLHRNRSELRRVVAKNLTLKFSPELRFKIDDTFDRMDDTRRMFEQDTVRRDIES